MPLKLQPNPTFDCQVSISVPGQEQKEAIGVTFRHLSRTGLREYLEGLASKTDAEGLASIVVGWTGIDEPFSKEALGRLLDNYPASSGEIFETYRRELLEARAKN